MPQEMSFAQALNEAKGVIIQLSNRVKADAEKVRTQQQTIVSQSSSITQHEAKIAEQQAAMGRHADEVAALEARIKELESVRQAAEDMINRQGERIRVLETSASEMQERVGELKSQIVEVSQERDALRAQVPSNDDSQALASMAALLAKAAPAMEKAKKSAGPNMKLADEGAEAVAEAA